MDISVLPNNNHPEKILQLDVRMLPVTHRILQVGAEISSERRWQNRMYLQAQRQALTEPQLSPDRSPMPFVDRHLDKHITPVIFTPNIKRNPLYMVKRTGDTGDAGKYKPSWTIQEYEQSIHGDLTGVMADEDENPLDLAFWLEDLYTPGFDSLLRKKKAERRRKKIYQILALALLCICVIIVIVTVPVVINRRK